MSDIQVLSGSFEGLPVDQAIHSGLEYRDATAKPWWGPIGKFSGLWSFVGRRVLLFDCVPHFCQSTLLVLFCSFPLFVIFL